MYASADASSQHALRILPLATDTPGFGPNWLEQGWRLSHHGVHHSTIMLVKSDASCDIVMSFSSKLERASLPS